MQGDMAICTHLLEHSFVYRLWQTPFANQKIKPLLATNDVSRARRVLDIGCGPGTNTSLFTHAEYLGIDINPDYLDRARRMYRRAFKVADAASYEPASGESYDLILMNSFLHHLKPEDVHRVLSRVATLLSPEGNVHILDLVQTKNSSVAAWLAARDRGGFPRPVQEWREIFVRYFDTVVFEPYRLTALRITLWNMVYFKGKRRAPAS
jgi:trans-aconitate methyltransferase